MEPAAQHISPECSFKKSGALRLCVDLRNVTKAITTVPTVKELASDFGGSSVFSKLDLQ